MTKVKTDLHKKIINAFLENPNKPLHQIATELKTTLSMVNTWTTKYLRWTLEERKRYMIDK